MRLNLAPAKPCTECGSDPVYHRLEYSVLLMDHIIDLVFSPITGRHISKKESSGKLVFVYELLSKLRCGEFKDEPDDKVLLLDKVLWEEAARRGIVMREFRFLGIPKNTFTATFPDGKHIDFEGIPLPSHKRVSWIDNKALMKKHFLKLGIPVAKGGSAFSAQKARSIFRSLTPPIVVKPFEGSASRHTSMHLTNEEELLRAFSIAKEVAPFVMVEEELQGAVYRPTVVNGTVLATIRRDPPSVVGDGIHSVEELITKENTHPKRKGPYFSQIKLVPLSYAELALQGLTRTSIPEKNRRVLLHPKINWALGGTTEDVTDAVHPDNKELFETIAVVLKAPIVGIDFIGDISRSWKKQKRCGVIECNSMPFFDNHHLPFEGKPRDIAGPIWDLVKKS